MAESADHTNNHAPEWSHFIKADEIEGLEKHVHISPDEGQRIDLARRLEVIALNDVKAKLTLKRQNRRVIKIQGQFSAHVTQSCVTTLQPVKAEISEEFEAWYADPAQAVSFARARHEKDKTQGEAERPVLEEFEDPEPIIDGQIDLGELVAQYLSLAIDPFPQCDEAKGRADEKNSAEVYRDTPPNPFAALKALKGDL